MSNHTIQDASLGAGITTGLMGVIAQNATVISLAMTAFFGLIYACCAIWNARSNSKRNDMNERAILESIIEGMIKDDEPIELIKKAQERKDKL